MTIDRAREEAAAWRARLDAPDCSLLERDEFERWKSASPLNAQAFAAVEALSRRLLQQVTIDSRLKALADSAYALGAADTRVVARAPRRRRAVLAMAASVALAAVGVQLLRISPEAVIDEAEHATGPRQRQDVALADGSLVQLDADSVIKVRFTGRERRIDLERGRAVFEVAHDASKPFIVSVGGEEVKALGTRFQVQLQRQSVDVVLMQGSVLVSDSSQLAEGQQRLVPGQGLSMQAGSPASSWLRRDVDLQVATSWARGRLLFRSTELADALVEINRYSTRPVVLGDPGLAGLPVSGNFLVGESDLAVSAFAAVLPIEIVQGEKEIILFRRRDNS